jgi:hypothetical protein
MADTKDRLGDKLRSAERAREDEYFERRDRELLAKARGQEGDEQEETLRQIARMRCPKDGRALDSIRLHGVNVERCPQCNGMWLDRGELEAIAGTESGGWIARVLGMK